MLISTSSSNSTSRRSLLPVPDRFLAALSLALGLGVLAPSLAHADEAAAPAASVDGSVAAPVAASEGRPLTMRDLSATSSIGIGAQGGMTKFDFFDETSTFYSGILKLDGALAIGDHLKLFASFPLTALEGEREDDGIAGHGNLTLGAQIQGGTDDMRAGGGISGSRGADEDSQLAILFDYDMPSYAQPGTVIQAFGTTQLGKPDRYFQLELDYTTVEQDSDDNGGEAPEIGTLKIGGGLRTSGGPMVLAELGMMDDLNSDSSDYLYLADLGVRGRVSDDSRATWGAKASLIHADGLTSFGVGFELRTDLPALGGK
jgi:hypothetical protein